MSYSQANSQERHGHPMPAGQGNNVPSEHQTPSMMTHGNFQLAPNPASLPQQYNVGQIPQPGQVYASNGPFQSLPMSYGNHNPGAIYIAQPTHGQYGYGLQSGNGNWQGIAPVSHHAPLKGNQLLLQQQQINFQQPREHQQTRMQQNHSSVSNVPHYGASQNESGGSGMYSVQSMECAYQQRSSIGVMGSPGTTGSHKVSIQSSSYGMVGGSQSRGLSRGKQVHSSTTADSTINAASPGGERSNSVFANTQSPGNFKDIAHSMGFIYGEPQKLENDQNQDFQRVQQIWRDPMTPQRQTKHSLSPGMLANAERTLQSPVMPNQFQIQQIHVNPQQQPEAGGTVKRFKRKRVNTKTPSRKSQHVVISSATMPWELAREIIDSIGQIVTSEQIKNCNMELEKQMIKVQLSSVEAAVQVIEALNNKIVKDHKLSAFHEKLPIQVASPHTGPALPSSQSPHINPPLPGNGPSNQPDASFMQLQNMAPGKNAGQPSQQPQQQQFLLMDANTANMQQARFSGNIRENEPQILPESAQESPTDLPQYLDYQKQLAMQQHICQCCRNGHTNLVMQHSHSNHSLSSHNDNFHPSGFNSSIEQNSVINRLNKSPGMIRTLEDPIKAGALGISNNMQSTESEHIYRSNTKVSLDLFCRHYNSHNQFPVHYGRHTPNSNKKSSNKTKSASGSQASSTSKSVRNNNSEPVDIERVKQGQDSRTYLCVKNIPCRYSKQELKNEINKSHKNRYTALDIIKDNKEPKKMTNMGYFFIDFKHPLFVVDFYEEYQGKTWELHNSDKKVGIYYGHTPKKDGLDSRKLDSYLLTELERLVQKYQITAPPEQFMRTLPQAQSLVSSFGQPTFHQAQFDQVTRSMSQVNLSSTNPASSDNNFAIAEDDKEQEANEFSEEKVKMTATSQTTPTAF